MGGRHPRFWAEVELAGDDAAQVEDVARKHGLVVLIGPKRLGLSAAAQVDALRAAFPKLTIEDHHAPPKPVETKKHNPGFEKLCEEVRHRIREITPTEACRRVTEHPDTVHFFDVREDHEWKEGHPRGAEHLSRGIIERDIESKVPDHGAQIILLCGGGFRSALAADNLARMGYTDVLSVAGGVRGWKAAGLPEDLE